MYDTILVPTDGSEGAETAARHAVQLATAFESQVHLLSVVDTPAADSELAEFDIEADDHRHAVEQRATDAVAQLEMVVTDAGIPCQTAVERGLPYETILAYAADHGVDLVSMGTHGRTGLDRVLLGSVTERVVRTSDIPVLTSRLEPSEPAAYETVLVPTDGSEASTAAVEHGLAVAARFDATVHALCVVEVAALAGIYDAGPGLPGMIDEMRDYCSDAVAAVERRCEDRGLEVVTSVVSGMPAGEIRDYIEEHHIDLVAMGTHGLTGLERYLLGSVTERIIRTGAAPVLTVRSAE